MVTATDFLRSKSSDSHAPACGLCPCTCNFRFEEQTGKDRSLAIAIAFKKAIYHFPFVILDLSLEEEGSSAFSSMTNLNLKNGK